MDVQELIEKYEGEFPSIGMNISTTIKFKALWDDILELDEPQPVQVPQFVADVIEGAREQGVELEDALHYTWGKGTKEFTEWYKKKSNRDLFARAWLDGYEIQGRKYVVTDGNHLYFKNYQEDIEIVILVDEQPGTMEYVKKFNTKEEAQKAADILGWKVQEVE